MLSSYTIHVVVWQSNTKSSILLMSNEWTCVLLKYGPVAQTGRALPLQGRGPGFKSRWVHLIFFEYVKIKLIFLLFCFIQIFCAAPFRVNCV